MLQIFLTISAGFAIEQATASCPGCEIPGRSGIAFINSKTFRGWSQSGNVLVAVWQVGGSEDKPSVQLFVVEDCSRS